MAISGPGVSGRRYCLMATLSPSLPLLKRAHVYIMTVPHLIQTITTTTTTMEEHLSFNKPSPENGVVFFDFSDNTSMSNMVDNIRHRLPMDKKFSSKALLLASTPIPSDEQLSTKVNKAIFSHRETIVLSKALKIVVTGLYVDGEYVDDVICLYPEKHTLNGILRYVVHLNMMLMDKAEDADEIRCGLIPLGRGFNREAFKFVDPVIPCAGYNILNGYHPDNGHQISPSSTQPQVQRRCAVKQMYKQINGMFEVVKQFSIKHNNRIFTINQVDFKGEEMKMFFALYSEELLPFYSETGKLLSEKHVSKSFSQLPPHVTISVFYLRNMEEYNTLMKTDFGSCFAPAIKIDTGDNFELFGMNNNILVSKVCVGDDALDLRRRIMEHISDAIGRNVELADNRLNPHITHGKINEGDVGEWVSRFAPCNFLCKPREEIVFGGTKFIFGRVSNGNYVIKQPVDYV